MADTIFYSCGSLNYVAATSMEEWYWQMCPKLALDIVSCVPVVLKVVSFGEIKGKIVCQNHLDVLQ